MVKQMLLNCPLLEDLYLHISNDNLKNDILTAPLHHHGFRFIERLVIDFPEEWVDKAIIIELLKCDNPLNHILFTCSISTAYSIYSKVIDFIAKENLDVVSKIR